MAKSEQFYIRAKVTTSGLDFQETEIDLGSFVNLGVSSSTLLKIHRVDVQYMDNNAIMTPILYDGAISGNQTKWQLTTQSQGSIVDMTDKSVCASGSLQSFTNVGTSGVNSQVALSETVDLNPSEFSEGYLIGVDSLFLGADNYAVWDTGDIDVCVLLHCSLVKATQANSVALALSQQ
jgi:hypothetical protein